MNFKIRFIKYGFLVPLLCLSSLLSGQYRENDIKAIYLEKFTRYVEWSQDILPDIGDEPFTIGVIGDHPFDTALDEIYQRLNIKNRSVRLVYFDSCTDITFCHLLFISKSEKSSTMEILETIKGQQILTVSDTKLFAEMGVMINLYTKDDEIHFIINETSVRESGLYVSYQLLKLATIVKPWKSE